MKTKVFNFIRASNGAPIEDAEVNIYVYVSGSPQYANIYPADPITSLPLTDPVTTDTTPLLTDSNGFFQFYVADKEESATYGYEFADEFKITWSKPGITAGEVDRIQLFDVANRPVDVLGDSTLLNKMVSDSLAKSWDSHLTNNLLDAHTQYILADGTRGLSGHWDVGAGWRIRIDDIRVRDIVGNTLKLWGASSGITIQYNGRVDIPNINIDSGTIDGTIIGGVTPAAGSFSTVNIDGGTIDGTIIGGVTPAAGSFSTVDINAGTIDGITLGTNVPVISAVVTTIDINGGTIDGTIIGGTIPAAGSFSTVNIDGGTIDGTVIGGSTPAAGTFSTLTVPNITISTLATIESIVSTDITVDEITVDIINGDMWLGTMDLSGNIITNIGTSGSYFDAGGGLVLHGSCSVRRDYEIDNQIMLSSYYDNTIIGINAGFGIWSATPDIGIRNTFIGRSAAYGITTGDNNVIIGDFAAYSLNSGNDNIAIGRSSLFYNTVGGRNIAIGKESGFSNDTGSSNISIGPSAGYYSVLSDNIYIGRIAGFSSVGSNNICIGHEAGYNSTGDNNIFIGNAAGYNVDGTDISTNNSLYIDNATYLDEPPLLYGSFGLKRIGLGTVLPQYKLDINGEVRLHGDAHLYFGGSDSLHPLASIFYGESSFYGDALTISTTVAVSGAMQVTSSVEASGGIYVSGDGSGLAGAIGLSNVSSGVSSGTGTVKMGSGSNADSTGWIKIYVGTDTRYIPYWNDDTP